MQHVVDEHRDVVLALTQRGETNAEDVETVEEVFAEEAGRDHRFEVLVRRGNEANAHFERSRSTDPLNLSILDGAEDLGLRWE